MKKTVTFISVLCFLTISVSQGQVKQGRTIMGLTTAFNNVNFGTDLASLGFSTVKYKGDSQQNVDPDVTKVTTIFIQPKFGLFIADNFALGLNVSVGSSASKPKSGGKYSMTSFGVGPFVRYYLPGSKVMPFLEVNSLFGSLKTKNEYLEQSYSSTESSGSVGAGAGLAVKLGDKVTFDMMALYNSVTEKAKENNPNNNKTVYGNISFKFGFAVLFGSK